MAMERSITAEAGEVRARRAVPRGAAPDPVWLRVGPAPVREDLLPRARDEHPRWSR